MRLDSQVNCSVTQLLDCFISQNVIGVISQPEPAPVESPGRRCSTRSGTSLLLPDLTDLLLQAAQSERPSDSEATAEGAVRGQSGSAGEEEQSVLQVDRSFFSFQICFCFSQF